MILRLLLILVSTAIIEAALQNCPMSQIRNIIIRATQQSKEPATQMQMVRRIVEDIYGGTWGVLIIRNPSLVSHAFCLTVVNRWQYNVFKTGSRDTEDRVSVTDIVNRIRQSDDKPRPVRLSVAELDRKLARAIEIERARRSRG